MACIFDRGYPSVKLIDQMSESGQYFVFRLKANDFKREYEELCGDEDDKWIDVIYDRLRSNHFREVLSVAFSTKKKLVKKASVKMDKEMMRHLCPVRHDRDSIYSRKKKRVNKHRMTYRYSY